MTRDYKPRDQERRDQGRAAAELRKQFNRDGSVGMWRWMLITALIIGFVVFLVYLSTEPKQLPQLSQSTPGKTEPEKKATPIEKTPGSHTWPKNASL